MMARRTCSTLMAIGIMLSLSPEPSDAGQPTDRDECQPLLDDFERVRSLKPADDEWPLFVRCMLPLSRVVAEAGDTEMQFVLGFVYSTGQGVPQDYVQAAQWFHRAAVRGHASAQVNLGLAYTLGRGVPRDNVRAHAWLNLGAAKLSGTQRENAVKARNLVESVMTVVEIQEAQRLAREWRPRE